MRKNYSPVFIVGCARSGTTLLRNLLNSHPEIKFPPESHFILDFYHLFGDPKTEKDVIRILDHIKKHKRFKKFEICINKGEVKDIRRYSELIDYIYTKFIGKYDAKRWGDKTPLYVLDLKLLVKLFSNAKIIHIIRDGRDVADSIIKTYFGPNNTYLAAKYWKKHVEAGNSQGQSLGTSRYKEIKYEDLLNNSEQTLRSVCSFINIKYNKRINKVSPSYSTEKHRKFLKRARPHNPHTKIIKSNQNKWKQEMSEKDILMFESVAGDTLRKFKYETRANINYNISFINLLYFNLSDFCLRVSKKLRSATFLEDLTNFDLSLLLLKIYRKWRNFF